MRSNYVKYFEKIANNQQYLGNLGSLRDCGYTENYVERMWLILQQEKPKDFVISAGVQHTVREFCY